LFKSEGAVAIEAFGERAFGAAFDHETEEKPFLRRLQAV